MMAALLTLSLALADARTTLLLRGPELNPIMRGLCDRPVALYGVKVGSAVLTAWTISKVHSSGHPTAARWLWVGINVAQGLVVWHNVRELHKQR